MKESPVHMDFLFSPWLLLFVSLDVLWIRKRSPSERCSKLLPAWDPVLSMPFGPGRDIWESGGFNELRASKLLGCRSFPTRSTSRVCFTGSASQENAHTTRPPRLPCWSSNSPSSFLLQGHILLYSSAWIISSVTLQSLDLSDTQSHRRPWLPSWTLYSCSSLPFYLAASLLIALVAPPPRWVYTHLYTSVHIRQMGGWFCLFCFIHIST